MLQVLQACLQVLTAEEEACKNWGMTPLPEKPSSSSSPPPPPQLVDHNERVEESARTQQERISEQPQLSESEGKTVLRFAFPLLHGLLSAQTFTTIVARNTH